MTRSRLHWIPAALGMALSLGCQKDVEKSHMDDIAEWAKDMCACKKKEGKAAEKCAEKVKDEKPEEPGGTGFAGQPKYKLESLKAYDEIAGRGTKCYLTVSGGGDADDEDDDDAPKKKKKKKKGGDDDGEEPSSGIVPSFAGGSGGLGTLTEATAIARIVAGKGIAKARWDDGMGGKQLVIDIEPGTSTDLGHGIATLFDTTPGASTKAVGALGKKAIYTLDAPNKQTAIDTIAATECMTGAACGPALAKMGMRNNKIDAPADLSGYFDHTVFGDVGDEYLVFKVHDVAAAVDGRSTDTAVKFEGRRALVVWMAGGEPSALAAARRAATLLSTE